MARGWARSREEPGDEREEWEMTGPGTDTDW